MTAHPDETDVVVMGSGGAALVAALAATEGGLRVTVIERSGYVGGTTALSGGLVWVANNRHMRDAGLADSVEEATTYVARLAAGRRSIDAIRAIVQAGPAMVDFLETASGLRFEPLNTWGRVLHIRGGPIPNLYAAGD